MSTPRLLRVAPLKSLYLSLLLGGRVVVGRGTKVRVHRTARVEFSSGARLTIGVLGEHPTPASLRLHARSRLRLYGPVQLMRGATADVGPSARLSLGTGVRAGEGVAILCHRLVNIGDGCTLGWDARIRDGVMPHTITGGAPDHLTAPVVLGPHVKVLPGAQINAGVVLAPHSVVAAGVVLDAGTQRTAVTPGTSLSPSPIEVRMIDLDAAADRGDVEDDVDTPDVATSDGNALPPMPRTRGLPSAGVPRQKGRDEPAAGAPVGPDPEQRHSRPDH